VLAQARVVGVLDLGGAKRDLHGEVEHRPPARSEVGLAVVDRDLIGDERVLLVDAQDRAVCDDTVETVVGRAGRDDDHLALRLAQAALLEHERVVVREEGPELVGAAGQDQEHVRHEAGLLLHLDDARTDVIGHVLQGGHRKSRDGHVGHDASFPR
jgi:hypothetical protein